MTDMHPSLWEVIGQSDQSPICAFDHEYRLIGFNRAHSDEFFRIYDYRVQIGDVFPDLFLPEQAPVIRGFMTRALAGEVFNVTEEFGDPDLFKPYWDIYYAPLRNGDGTIIGAFHHAKDISARLRAEASLRGAEDALRQSQKMEAVGQLTGGVAHDFNNLLTVVKSAVEMLKLPDQKEERRARYVAAIDEAVGRAAKLTQQLLAFARRQTLRPETFSTNANIEAMAEMMQTLVGARVTIDRTLPGEPLCVNADTNQFDTALVNMAVNARDAMEGEGQLTVTVRATEGIPAIRERPAVDGPFVAISIADTGSGIAPGDRERIFEPFYTTKVVGKGTGLGLSQVFGFARQSGGEIQVESEVGVGSRFTLYLPRVATPANIAELAAPVEVETLETTPCVLVVEDNAEVAASTVDALDQLGFTTVLATNGNEGLREIANDAERFDVVFSDVVMPGMTGIEMGREIRRIHGGLPVVLASGYSHVLAAGGTEGFELIHKPYSIDQVSRILRRAAAGRERKAA
ncbi:response regulator [Sphingomonas sp. AP4-R1]|uniref:PAS domain-containing sensor histidine kinase n=1 Tax=Sphingomonas sp. AP4-R1 TaxID=2735134 RepID=UPI00149352F6|nr:PAS domain-containing sensor histidine kinase [Sphingomonas sp. AP4-R1]QJU58810.1 response regulator [Sphingomonas sp. AP4-R1]